MPEKVSGVYCIENTATGKRYIGSSINIAKRFRIHQRQLDGNNHPNKYLQRSWNKRESRFIFYILEECPREDLFCREQFWIDRCESSSRDKGYNILPVAGTTRGYKHSPETIERMRKPHNVSEEGRKAIQRAWKGKSRGRENRKKLSDAASGKYVGEKNPRATISDAKALEILSRVNKGERVGRLAKEYGVTSSVISHLKAGVTFTHLDREHRTERG